MFRLLPDLPETTTDGYFSLDDEGRFTSVNREAELAIGLAGGELLGRSAWEVFPEAARSELYAAYRRAVEERVVVRVVGPSRGEATRVECTLHPTGHGLSVYVRDVTERHRAEERLLEAERRAQTMAGRMRAVAAAAAGLIGVRSAEELQTVIQEACRQVIPLDVFTLALYDADRQVLRFLPGWDEGTPMTAAIVPVAGTPSERVIRERVSKVIESSADPAGQGASLDGTTRRSESVIRTPIASGERILGVISVQSYTPGRYTAEDVEVLEAVASMTATALTSLELLAEQRLAESALERSERYFRTLIESSQDVITILDADGVIRYESPALERVLGFTPEETVGRSAFDLVHPDDRDALGAVYRQLLLHPGRWFSLHFRTRHRDGAWRVLQATARNLLHDPDVAGVVVSSRDVTQRRRADEMLRESEERFRTVVENLGEGLFITDAEGRLVYVNRRAEEITGYFATELAGKVLGDLLVGAEEQARLEEGMRRPGASSERYSLRMRRSDGREVATEVVATPLQDAEGGMVGALGAFTDVSDRVAAEVALRETNQTLEALIAAMPLAIVTLDRSGRVTMWNAAAERTFGWRAEEVLGETPPLVPAERVVEARHILDEALEDRPVAGLETERQRRDGSPVDVTLWSAPLRDADGVVQRVLGVYADVTERKRLEAQFLQAQKMEAVGRLAGGIAHDFNNLLTAIKGNTELLLMDAAEDDPAREDLGEIRRAADRAADLTRQLLAFGRRQMLQPRLLDLNRTVAELGGMLRRVIEAEVEIRTHLDPSLGRVQADPGQIEQVLMNLVVNARDAIEERGTISISTRNRAVDEADPDRPAFLKPGDYVVLTVRDTGSGIDAEHLPHLFEPFFTTKESGKGTGLGLSTVYGIVKQSEGYVLVESAPEKGTSFEVYLPRVEGPLERPTVPQAPPETHAGRETVLLVEDDALVRQLAHKVLERSGYTVLQAADGEQALAVLEQRRMRIDLLLTDVVMPRMGGRTLAKRLRTLDPSLRVVFMSGYTGETLAAEGFSEPESAFVAKPFAPDELSRVVREVLAKA